MKDELFKKVYIKSEADLPEETGEYYSCLNGTINYRPFIKGGNIFAEPYWMDIDWYLLPIEVEKKDEFKKISIKSRIDLPEETGCYFGCRLGVKTLLEFEKGKSEINWLKEVRWYISPKV